MKSTLSLAFATAFLFVALDGPAANAQSRRPPRRGGNNSALNNQMLGMFNANQQRNSATVNRGRSSQPIYRGVRTVNPFDGTTTRRAPTVPNYTGGQRLYVWPVPYGAPTYNNNMYPSPPYNGNGSSTYRSGSPQYTGKTTFSYDPNAVKSNISGPPPR